MPSSASARRYSAAAAGAPEAVRPFLYNLFSDPAIIRLPAPLRWLFGYGPDTFRYVFPLRAPGRVLEWLTSAAHNDAINRLVELGAIGIAVYGTLGVAAVTALWRLTRSQSAISRTLAIAVGAMLALSAAQTGTRPLAVGYALPEVASDEGGPTFELFRDTLLGIATRRDVAAEVHLPESVLGVREALGHEQVVQRFEMRAFHIPVAGMRFVIQDKGIRQNAG